jgi:hypothetical protein
MEVEVKQPAETPKPLAPEVSLFGTPLFKDDAVRLYSARAHVSHQEAEMLLTETMEKLGMWGLVPPRKEPEPESEPENVPVGYCERCGTPYYTLIGICGGCHPEKV